METEQIKQEEAEYQKWKGLLDRDRKINDKETLMMAGASSEFIEKNWERLMSECDWLKGDSYFEDDEDDITPTNNHPKINKREIVLMTKFSPVPFSEEILNSIKIVFDKHKNLWRYDSNEGIWKPNAEQFLRTIIRNKLLGDEQQKRNYVEEIISHIKDVTFNESFEPDNNPYLIAFENKIYDLKDNTFKDFSEKYFITNKIPIRINQDKKECSLIDNFFSESIGEEYKHILYDLFAYCLFRGQPYQKLFFIYGPASTGKSQILNLLEKFLGQDNFCSVEPQKIQTDPYSTAQMWLKSANIVSDINYDALDNINQIKKMTGGDTITVREIYKAPFKTKIYSKQIFSTNKLPSVKEKTRAWYRRVYPIEFSNIVSKEKEDPNIVSKMCEEFEGFVIKVIEHLRGLYEHNFKFTWDINIDEVSKVYEELSNPIMLFIKENCAELVGNSEYWVYDYEFKDRLNNWLRANHFPKMTKGQINEYMNEIYNDSNRPSFNGEKNYRVWVGLKWGKNLENSDSFNQFNQFNQVSKRVYVYRECFQNPVKSVKLVKEPSNA
jgi:putative DNA primase/helicase